MLRWLYEEKVTRQVAMSNMASAKGLGAYGFYYGKAFTDQEVGAAAVWLRDRDFVRGLGSAQAEVLRATITALGEDLVEDGGSVNEQRQPAASGPTSHTYNFNGSQSNIAVNGQTVHQTITVNADQRHQVTEVADAFERLIRDAGPTAERAAEAAQDVEQLRAAINDPKPDAGLVKELLLKVRDKAIDQAGAAAAGGLTAMVTELLGRLS